jgi:uncharacterized Zn finger protein (UPF0148 family)
MQTLIKTKLHCKHCGGELFEDDGEIRCLQCGRPHDKYGNLINCDCECKVRWERK